MLAPLLTAALLYIGYTCYSLHITLSKIRPLGIPYFITPFYPTPIARAFLFPFLKLLIKAFGLSHHHQLVLMTGSWQVRQRYEIYRQIGSDIFFTVSPTGNAVLHVADPDMAVEILAGKGGNGELYPKTASMSKNMEIYGKNVLTVEGATWRAHRKVTGTVIGKS